MAEPTYVPSSGRATMPQTELAPPDLRSYVAPLRRRKWWVIWTAVLGLVGTGSYVLVAHKEYTASAQLLVQPTRGSISLNNTQQTISPTDVATQIQLAESAPVLTLAEAALKFQPAVTVSQLGTTDVMSISATSTSKTQAASIANTYARVFVSYQKKVAIQNLTAAELQLEQQISSISTQLNQLSVNSPGATALGNEEAVLKEQLAQLQVEGVSTSGGVELVASATVPTSPSSPKVKEFLGIGLGAGLVLGAALAFLIDFLNDAVYTREDLESTVPGPPLLGLVPLIGTWKNRKDTFTISATDPSSPIAEAFRSTR
jgi:uncharacterized protein involved in exopolysaccharide biosynthesis